MELLRGETLKHYLARAGGKGLAADEVILFSQQAASALAAAHAKGIIHRDIKPANLFVVDAGRGKRLIKILDFGLAKKQPGVAVAESRTYGFPGAAARTRRSEPVRRPWSSPVPARRWGRWRTCLRSRPRVSRWIRALTCSAWAPLFSKWRPGRRPSPVVPRRKCLPRCCAKSAPGQHGEPGDAEEAGFHRRQIAGQGSGQRYATAEQLQEALDGLDPQSGHAMVTTVAGPKRSWATIALVVLLALIAGGLAWWKFRPGAASPAGESTAGTAARNLGLDYPGRLHQPHRRSGL